MKIQKGFVRIIAGKWRGRRLKVIKKNDLRPTGDRVRETLFNWLSPYISGAYCLDLFAGSGALSFEALSRGAAYVVMVDADREVVALLQDELASFNIENAEVDEFKIPDKWPTFSRPFDIVFLDPPYQKNLLLPTCQILETKGFLAEGALIYLEAHQVIKDNDLPKNWRLIKSERAGSVFYHLAQRKAEK
jgi:16S rRNA (guanine966-N2)-methyltransferase